MLVVITIAHLRNAYVVLQHAKASLAVLSQDTSGHLEFLASEWTSALPSGNVCHLRSYYVSICQPHVKSKLRRTLQDAPF